MREPPSTSIKPCLSCGGPLEDSGLAKHSRKLDLTCKGPCGSYWGEWTLKEWNGQWAHKRFESLVRPQTDARREGTD